MWKLRFREVKRPAQGKSGAFFLLHLLGVCRREASEARIPFPLDQEMPSTQTEPLFIGILSLFF